MKRLIAALILLLALPAQSAVLVDSYHYASADVATGLLSDIDGIGSVFELDATLAASVSDTANYFKNAEAAPADGSAQTAYDFQNIGAMPFVSSGAASHWNPGTSDYFVLGGLNTAFFNGLHKTTGGTDWWMVIAINSDGSFDTDGIFTTSNSGIENGLRINESSTEVFNFYQGGETGYTGATGAGVVTGFTSGDHLVALSYDHATDTLYYSRNSTTFSQINIPFNASTTDTSETASIGVIYDAIQPNNDVNWYTFAMGNTVMSEAQLAEVHTILNARHARDYTP